MGHFVRSAKLNLSLSRFVYLIYFVLFFIFHWSPLNLLLGGHILLFHFHLNSYSFMGKDDKIWTFFFFFFLYFTLWKNVHGIVCLGVCCTTCVTRSNNFSTFFPCLKSSLKKKKRERDIVVNFWLWELWNG